MYEIHGLSLSSNTTKTVYVAEALELDYHYTPVDLFKGQHKTPEHLQRHPLGKVPTLTHDGRTLFESNAICSYLAHVNGSALYPNEPYQRAVVDQWMLFFTNHLGRWLNDYAFEKMAKAKFGLGEPNAETLQKALEFIQQQLPCVDAALQQGYIAGQAISIADYVAFAYLENAKLASIPLTDYSHILRWYAQMDTNAAIVRARARLHPAAA